MIDLLTTIISDQAKVLILGFGKEGRSTYSFLRKHFPELVLGIADSNSEIVNDELLLDNNKLKIFTGDNYLDSLDSFDIIIKSPGVYIGDRDVKVLEKVTSQTDLFLQCYANQTIGVTGTKGKSTTSSLIRHFFEADNRKVMLLGNIGVPAFDMIDNIEDDTIIVYELSAHQLEYIKKSPHIAVLLNIFPEHLDYFNTFNDYQRAKFNICNFQKSDDCLIIHESLLSRLPYVQDSTGYRRVSSIIEISGDNTRFNIKKTPLAGSHNLVNIEAALIAVSEAGVDIDVAISSLMHFLSLPHRLEYVGEYGGIRFVNDSISTIPESTIAAVKAIDGVDTLILGGYDRGLDYVGLTDFLSTTDISNFVFLGMAGNRMFDLMKVSGNKNLIKAKSIEEAFNIIPDITSGGSICLLSPAAASYDQFHNFEHRGDTFKLLATKL